MTTQVYASDQPLLTIVLTRGNDEAEDDRAGIAELLAAAESLSKGWLVPLGVSSLFAHCDPANYFEEVGPAAQANPYVRVDRLPVGVWAKPAFSHSVVELVTSIDEAVIRSAVTRRLDQPAPHGLVTSLSMLWWTSVRARSPNEEIVELIVPVPVVSTVSEMLDGARWFFGPTSGIAGPPARLRATNSHFTTTLVLEVYWDLWIGYPAGRALVDAGVARVLSRPGWERTAS